MKVMLLGILTRAMSAHFTASNTAVLSVSQGRGTISSQRTQEEDTGRTEREQTGLTPYDELKPNNV